MLAAERCAGKLAAAVRNDLVDVHVELGAAARHPNMQRKHVAMAASEYFVTDARDQRVNLIGQPAISVVRGGSRTFYHRVGSDHFAEAQVPAEAETRQQ